MKRVIFLALIYLWPVDLSFAKRADELKNCSFTTIGESRENLISKLEALGVSFRSEDLTAIYEEKIPAPKDIAAIVRTYSTEMILFENRIDQQNVLYFEIGIRSKEVAHIMCQIIVMF